MIKLFWNSHNLRADSNYPGDPKQDIAWGIYHKENSDKWIKEILNKIEFKSIDDISEVDSGDKIIIVDSNVDQKIKIYTQLQLVCSKVFLIHLGNESVNPNLSPIYDKFNFVWRAFCSGRYFNNKKVRCLPIGYKSGTVFNNNLFERKYKWAFMGTPHKSSRHDLLFQLSDIKPAFLHKTEKFNTKVINAKKMSDILSLTEFIPCPNGFFHPETYRIYEALECGCIPIVENAYNYYDRLFPSNPFLRVDKWQEARLIIKEWKKEKIIEKQKECRNWWQNYKNQLQDFIKHKVIL